MVSLFVQVPRPRAPKHDHDGRNLSCSPVTNASVEVWQCDATGNYSEYSQPGYDGTGQTFLRGVQTTDSQGKVTFRTIYPGWYMGRATHIHLEVFVNGA